MHSPRRRILAVLTAVGALLGALGTSSATAAAPPSTDSSEVVHWNQVAASTLGAIPGPNGGAPPAFQINMAMVQAAVYDAVSAIGPVTYRPYVLETRTGARASEDVATATAAYDVISWLLSTAPERVPFPTRPMLMGALDSAYDTSIDAIPNNMFKRQGVAVGHAAAAAMRAARTNDGRFGPSPWMSNTAAGHWQPLIVNGAPALDPTPWAGNVTPFMMTSPSQFRSAPPPALNSTQWATELNEVKAIGRATESTRTDFQTYVARWWQSAPVFSWNDVARQLITRSGLSAEDSARLLALQNMAGADASINCWNDKYHFDFWRPWNAITADAAHDDDNPLTQEDPTWTALITAPYPEWTSGHNCLDGSHALVLRAWFGDDPVGGPFHITSTATNHGGNAVREFETFTEPLTELIEARIWAGLHYRSADVAGQLLGRNVASYGMTHYLQPVRSGG